MVRLHAVENVAPAEQALQQGDARVRIVDVHEKLDISTYGADGGNGGNGVRFRVSFLPSRQGFRINIKGLNCFVKSSSGRPTPAIVAESDGVVAFVSTAREELGHIAWSFGRWQHATPGEGGWPATPEGRVFQLATGEMVVPSPQATQAVALFLGRDRDVIIMCRR